MTVLDSADVVGRDEELATIAELLEDAESLPRAILVEGEAGIGKTTVWRESLSCADGSYRLLVSRPSASETQISFAALQDLMDGVAEEALSGLPGPQRRALEVALLLADPEESAEQGAVAVGLLGSLRALAREGPVLIAIDDVHWLDGASAAALQFALRRIEAEQIALLLSQRMGKATTPLGLDRAFPEGRIDRIHVGPLSVGAVQQVIHARLGVGLPRPLLRRVHETAGGNPFFALELARSLQARGPHDLGTPLELPDSLQRLVAERLAELPAETRAALELAAALGEPRVDVVEAAGADADDLAGAVDAHVIEIDRERIHFTHPLLASVLYANIDSVRRREIHERLSAASPGGEERARHLALASTRPDAAVAAELHEAARGALGRGAPGASAELLEHALRLTPEGDESRASRTLELAEAYFEAGDTARAGSLFEDLIAETEGSQRAEVLLRLGTLKDEVEGAEVAVALFEEALDVVGGDPLLEARIRRRLARTAVFVGDDEGAARHARGAVELAEQLGDEELLAQALATFVFVELVAGRKPPPRMLERALELEPEDGRLRIDECPTAVYGLQLMLELDLDRGREQHEVLLERAVERGDETNESAPLFYLTQIEIFAGNWQRAAEHLERAAELAEQTGVNRFEVLFSRAFLDALLGKTEAARDAAERGVDCGEPLLVLRNLSALGFLDLSAGELQSALAHFGRAAELAERAGVRDPWFARFAVDQAETLIAAGALDEAEAVLDSFEDSARELDRGWARALAGRSRALLLASRGDLDAAQSMLEAALDELEHLPFEHARALLALGTVQRRAGKKRAARESLQAARAVFEELGAELWVGRVDAELKRIGGRAPSSGDLTPSESRIAQLVAEGKTNKEVAAELFVTVHTVEQALTRVYRKLGIRSRTQLAHRLAAKA
jgi:DNA-binding CsgD family transcriptional regulator